MKFFNFWFNCIYFCFFLIFDVFNASEYNITVINNNFISIDQLNSTFQSFGSFIYYIQSLDQNVTIWVGSNLTITEEININNTMFLYTLDTFNKIFLNFEGIGSFKIMSFNQFVIVNFVIRQNSLNSTIESLFVIIDLYLFHLKNCEFSNIFANITNAIVESNNTVTILIENTNFMNNQINKSNSNVFFKVSQIYNFTMINCTILNNSLIGVSFLITHKSSVYFTNIFILNNNIFASNEVIPFIDISLYFQIYNSSFFNNSMNIPILSNSINSLFGAIYEVMISFNNFYNLGSLFNSFINLKNIQNIEIANISCNNNEIDFYLIHILSANSLKLLNITFNENLSGFLIFLQNCLQSVIFQFLCNKNNIAYYENNQNSSLGSCMQISDSPLISIDSCFITNSIGILNIPGIMILNSKIHSKITIKNSIFSNNTFFSSESVESLGCSLYILSYPLLLLLQNYFSYNYVQLINEATGGPVLFYITEKISSVLFKDNIMENNYSYKKSLIIEFTGYNLSFQNCSFFNNSQHIYGFEDFYTEMIVNGIAQSLELINCNLIGNTASDGIFFLYEQRFLWVLLDNVVFLYNQGYLTAGFMVQFEMKNRVILLIHSIFSYNTAHASWAGTFSYLYTLATIIQFNFSIYNSIIDYNDCDPESNGLMVLMAYNNNISNSFINCTISHNTFFKKEIGDTSFIAFYGIRECIMVNMINVSIIDNIYGGTFLTLSKTNVILKDFLMDSNRNLHQNFIFSEFSNISMKNGKIVNNIIIEWFFLYFYDECQTIIDSVIFSNNTLGNYIILSQNNINLLVNNASFSDNLVLSPVAFFEIKNNQNLNITGNSFVNNYGFSSLFKETDSIIVHNSIFIQYNDNTANLSLFLFNILSSSINILNLSISLDSSFTIESLLVIKNSKLILENFSVYKTRYSGDFNIINVIQSSFYMKNSNINEYSNSYFLRYFAIIQKSDIFIENFSIYNYGNLFYFTFSNISLKNSTFSNIFSINSKNPILFINNYQIIMIDSIFSSFYSNFSAIKIFTSTQPSNIYNCSFINNTALDSEGGALYIQNSLINIQKCYFYRNNAIRGGGIYLYCLLVDKAKCNYSMILNVFIENTAIIDGGGLKYSYIEPILINNSFQNNVASYGSNYSSFFCKLGLEIEDNNKTKIFSSLQQNNTDLMILYNISSNQLVNLNIRLFPLDSYNQIISEIIKDQVSITILKTFNSNNRKGFNDLANLSQSNEFYCGLDPIPQYIGPLNQIQLEDFSFLFTNFTIIACPTSLIYFQFSTNISPFYPNTLYFVKNSLNEIKNKTNYGIILPISIKSCSEGQIYNIKGSYCEICPRGFYSILSETTICNKCLQNAACEEGGKLIVNPNFWNYPGFIEEIYMCNLFAKNCLGGETSQCNDGFEGILCHNCIQYVGSTMHYQDYLGNCNECPNAFVIITMYVVLIFSGVFAMKFILGFYMTGKGNERYNENQRFIIKIIVNIWHLCLYTKDEYNDVQLLGYESINFLKNIKFFWKIDYLFIPFDCLYFLSDPGNKNNAFIDTIFIISLVYFIMFCYYMRLKFKRYEKMKIFSEFMIIFYVILPALVKLISENLAFQNINGVLLLKSNNLFMLNDITTSFSIYFFILPNLAAYLIILFYQNIYLQMPKIHHKYKNMNYIVNCGILRNNIIFEILNFSTMIFFFLICTLDVGPDVKNPIVLFVFFYRFVVEYMICEFTSTIHRSINFIFKVIFIIDFIVLLYVTFELPFLAIETFLIIEMFLICCLIFYLIFVLNKCKACILRLIGAQNYMKHKIYDKRFVPIKKSKIENIKLSAYERKKLSF